MGAQLRLIQIQLRGLIAEADRRGQVAPALRILQEHAACKELRIFERLGQRLQGCVADIELGQPHVPFVACPAGKGFPEKPAQRLLMRSGSLLVQRREIRTAFF